MHNTWGWGSAFVKFLLLVLVLSVSMLAFPYPINASAQSLSQPLTVHNQTTGETIGQYQLVPSLRDASAPDGQNLNVTTIVYEDRFGREENNGGWNVFLRTTFSNDTSSTSGINLGGDSIVVEQTTLPNSKEISIPSQSESSVPSIPQKSRLDLGSNDGALPDLESPEVVSEFLNNNIDLLNTKTNEHLVHYLVIHSGSDKYAEKELGIDGQFVTTIAFDDGNAAIAGERLLNTFIQISHTSQKVNSLRGIQLGDDDIKVSVNGQDQGNLAKPVVIEKKLPPSESPVGARPTNPATGNITRDLRDESPPQPTPERLGEFTIDLQSRQFIPQPVLEIDNISGDFSAEDRVHFLIQFERLPNFNERRNITTTFGIDLLDYVTGNTYIASSLVSDLENLPRIDDLVRWAGPLLPADKISPDLKSQNIGRWAITENGQIVLTVQFHKDIPLTDAVSIIKVLGGNIISTIPSPEVDTVPEFALNATRLVNGTMPSLVLVTASFDSNMINDIAIQDAVQFVDVVRPPLEPTNDGARAAANVVPLAAAPYSLSGTGTTVLVYDVGRVDQTHPDFGARVIQNDGSAVADHATHVAATVGGSGANSNGLDSAGNPNGGTLNQWAGMAPVTNIRSFGLTGSTDVLYDSGGDLNNDFTTSINNGIDLATMSLGNNVVRNGFPCGQLGDYTNTAILIDNIVRGSINNQQLVFFESAGNERTAGGPCGQFSTISSPATAKNSIVMGALNSDNNAITGFTSFGPTDDGRLKPDIVAPGCENSADQIRSASFIDLDPDGPGGPAQRNGVLDVGEVQNAYVTKCGTSMATPVAAGSAALLTEQWQSTRGAGTRPLPHTVKAILAHTATDLGNAGPDYQFGWGALNAQAAVDLVRADDSANIINNDQVDNGDVDFYTFTSDGSANVRVTLAWDDPAATRLAISTLINNIDFRLIDPDGITYQPFVLNPATPANVATTGNDAINNVEMIVGNAKAGQWLVRVTGTTVPTGPQQYVVITPNNAIPGDHVPPLVTGTPDRAPDVNGFYTHPVTITWTGDDLGGSGIASCDPPTTYSGPAGSLIEIIGHCTDNAGNVGTGKVTINYDNPPDCSNASPSRSTLWPPNHRMVEIGIQGVTDIDGDVVTIQITDIRQDEPTTGLGSGNQSPDGAGIGGATAELRSERAGTGDGRVYYITFVADDGKGVTCNGEVTVEVPKSQSRDAVDQGPLYDSTLP